MSCWGFSIMSSKRTVVAPSWLNAASGSALRNALKLSMIASSNARFVSMKFRCLVSLEDDGAAFIEADQVENVLADIDADDGNLCAGLGGFAVRWHGQFLCYGYPLRKGGR